jgi:hypothetical protein
MDTIPPPHPSRAGVLLQCLYVFTVVVLAASTLVAGSFPHALNQKGTALRPSLL